MIFVFCPERKISQQLAAIVEKSFIKIEGPEKIRTGFRVRNIFIIEHHTIKTTLPLKGPRYPGRISGQNIITVLFGLCNAQSPANGKVQENLGLPETKGLGNLEIHFTGIGSRTDQVG